MSTKSKTKISKQQKQRQRFISLALVIIGTNLMILNTMFMWYRRTVLSFTVQPYVIAAKQRQATPVQIKLPTNPSGINIVPARIKNGIWETSEEAATFLATSARPEENGNIVIYAHNKRQLFGNLHRVELGQNIEVITKDGKTHLYRIDEITTVKPDQVEVVLPADEEILTLYTCTGILDSKRLVVKAKPLSSLSSNN